MKLNLDLSKVDSAGGGGDDLLPVGSYTGRIVGTDLIKTNSGHALKVVFNVTAGDHEGAQFSDFLNIINDSELAQKIAQGKIKKIMEVGGHKNPGALQDSEELHGLVVMAKLTQEPNYKDSNYTDNKVKGYSAVQSIQSVGAMKTNTKSMGEERAGSGSTGKAKLPWE